MKTWLLLLLLLSFQASISCKRKRCKPPLKMNAKGRCIKGHGSTQLGFSYTSTIKSLASHLRSTLGADVLIPCAYELSNDRFNYCEVCFKNDPGKILCPRENEPLEYDYVEYRNYRNESVYSDLSDWLCSHDGSMCSNEEVDGWRVGRCRGGYSYWTGYDDGSICDCGTPFFIDWNPNKESAATFRPLTPTYSRPGFHEGATFTDEITGAPYRSSLIGSDFNEKWEAEGWSGAGGVWDSRPPNVEPKSCSRRPDISSIFELHLDQSTQKLESIHKKGNGCILEDTYLAWHNGEPIETETRQSEGGVHSWCEAKCSRNPECGAWTLNKNNGWCALKRKDQVKKQGKKNFVSGIKTAKF